MAYQKLQVIPTKMVSLRLHSEYITMYNGVYMKMEVER